jgi:glucosyl-dolichyl phosphate glucuronosyltransferase
VFPPTYSPETATPAGHSRAAKLSLDVLIPTLNRADLLHHALGSLLEAPIPAGLSVMICIIENRCTDRTAELARRLMHDYPDRLKLIHEERRGKSRALNAGIAATSGDLVGMIDDDETIDAGWYGEVLRAFQDETLDFVGGPYRPDWGSTPRRWVPDEYLAVLGASDSGPAEVDYSPSFPGMLKGGNAVIRRRVLARAGRYAEHLGPSTHRRLLSCEDEDMYYRLLKLGARGRYLPSLVVNHTVLPERLTPTYYRRWCFWRGVSRGLLDRRHRLPVPYLAGIPRFIHGRAIRGLARLAGAVVRRRVSERSLADELPLWDLAGFAWGKHVYPLARFLPLPDRRTLADTRPAGDDVPAGCRTS